MESLRRLQLEAENIKDMQVGEVTVGVTSLTAVLKGMGESITAFQIRNPRVRIRLIELRPYQIIQQIRDGTLDFAITSQQHTQRLNLDWESLSRMPGLVVCRKPIHSGLHARCATCFRPVGSASMRSTITLRSSTRCSKTTTFNRLRA